MEAKVYLNRYRLYVDQIGLPQVIRRSAGEATFKAKDLQEQKDVALQVVSITELRTVVREQLEAEAKPPRTDQPSQHSRLSISLGSRMGRSFT